MDVEQRQIRIDSRNLAPENWRKRNRISFGPHLDLDEDFVVLRERLVKQQRRVRQQRAMTRVGSDSHNRDRGPRRPCIVRYRNASADRVLTGPETLGQFPVDDPNWRCTRRILRPKVPSREQPDAEVMVVTG